MPSLCLVPGCAVNTFDCGMRGICLVCYNQLSKPVKNRSGIRSGLVPVAIFRHTGNNELNELSLAFITAARQADGPVSIDDIDLAIASVDKYSVDPTDCADAYKDRLTDIKGSIITWRDAYRVVEQQAFGHKN